MRTLNWASRHIGKYGRLEVRHYDFLSQVLSKVERGHAKDLLDATEMLLRKLVTLEDLLAPVLSALLISRISVDREPVASGWSRKRSARQLN